MHDECVDPDAAELALALVEAAARHELRLGGETACALRLGFGDQRLRGISQSELVVVVGGVQVSATSLGHEPLAAPDPWMTCWCSPRSTSPS